MSETTSVFRDVVPLLFTTSAGTYALHEAAEMTTFGSIFPSFAGGVIVVGSVVLIIQVLFFRKPGPKSPSPTSGRAWLLAALLLAWALFLPITGFVVTSLLGSAGVLAVSQNERPSWSGLLVQAGSSAVFVFGVAFVFGTFLNVPLP